MRHSRAIAPRDAVLTCVLVLVVAFLVGLFLWLGGLQMLGTVLILALPNGHIGACELCV